MPFLEDELDPRKLCWLGENLSCISDASRRQWHDFAAACLATCTPRDVLYAKEVVHLLAHTAERLPEHSHVFAFAVKRHHLTSKRVPDRTPETMARLELALREGTNDTDVHRLYAYMVADAMFESMSHTSIDHVLSTHEQGKRLQQLLTEFSKEVTFKVHGDAVLHAEIVTCILNPFVSSMLAHLETPYQLVASAYPTQVNDMVRPLLNAPARERVTMIRWRGPHKVRDVLIATGLLLELIGQKAITLVTNATLCRGDMSLPKLYVRRSSDGVLEVGVRYNRVYSKFDSECSVCDILATYLSWCQRDQIDGTLDCCAVILDDVGDSNPLSKYLTRKPEQTTAAANAQQP